MTLPSLAQQGELDARAALGLGPLPTMHLAFGVPEDVSEAALATAFSTVVRRHAPLRSTMSNQDEHDEAIDETVSDTGLGKSSWRVRVDQPECAFVDYWSTSDNAEFLHARPRTRIGSHVPIAASVFTAEGRPQRIVISIDHLAFDGVSVSLLTDEMNRVLDNLRSGSAPDAGLPMIEQDYYTLARSERAEIERTLAECTPYWREAFARCGAYPAVELPGLDPEPPADLPERVITEVEIADLAPFRRFCQARQATPFVVFQAALAAAISRLGGRYTGANSNASYRTDPRTWHLIGFFSNLITFAPPPPENATDPLGWIGVLRTTAIEAVARSLVSRATLLKHLFPDTYPARPSAPHLHFELDAVPPSGSRERGLALLPPLLDAHSVKSLPGLECTAVMLGDDGGLLRVAHQDGRCAPEAVRALLDTWRGIVENELAEK